MKALINLLFPNGRHGTLLKRVDSALYDEEEESFGLHETNGPYVVLDNVSEQDAEHIFKALVTSDLTDLTQFVGHILDLDDEDDDIDDMDAFCDERSDYIYDFCLNAEEWDALLEARLMAVAIDMEGMHHFDAPLDLLVLSALAAKKLLETEITDPVDRKKIVQNMMDEHYRLKPEGAAK